MTDSDNQQCRHWNRSWRVTRNDISLHLNDWADDGTVQVIRPAIYGWPGVGNIWFEAQNGFPLPYDDHTLAPFYDRNQNGFYEPHLGEYPHPEGLDPAILAADISWALFHPQQNFYGNSHFLPKIDIQQTYWSLSCINQDDLNHTIFCQNRFINFGERLDSCIVALFAWMAIGCDPDDGIGTLVDQQAFYVYNKDNDDEMAVGSAVPIGINPPAFAVMSLNRALYKTIYIAEHAFTDFQFYHYMNGYWPWGQPITRGGTGQDPESPTRPKSDYIFTGDPADPDAWAMTNVPPVKDTWKTLTSIYLGNLMPQKEHTIDWAFVMMADRTLNNLQQVDALRDRLAFIRQEYAIGFTGDCTYKECANADCLWPGDTNRDGIVDHHDLLPLGVAWGAEGPQRAEPVIWKPTEAPDWNVSYNNQYDLKYVDASGNGRIDSLDVELVSEFTGVTHPLYQPPQDDYFLSDDVYLEIAGPSNQQLVQPGGVRQLKIMVGDVPGLYGLSLSLEIVDTFWSSNFFISPNHPPGALHLYQDKVENKHYSLCLTEPSQSIPQERVFSLILISKDTYSANWPDSTRILLKNVRGVRSDGTPIELGGRPITFYFDKSTTAGEPESRQANLTLFPNPARDELHVLSPQVELNTIHIFDVHGRMYQLANFPSGDHQQRIDVSALPAGMYFLRVGTSEGVICKWFVVE